MRASTVLHNILVVALSWNYNAVQVYRPPMLHGLARFGRVPVSTRPETGTGYVSGAATFFQTWLR